MGYLFFQTWIWLLIAALLGLFIGWLIWRKGGGEDCSTIQGELEQCRKNCSELEQTINSLQTGQSESIFLTQPDGDSDDLKKISGVGEKLEQTLNGLGIFHFRQIAAFTKENIDWVDDKLKFHGRIERDDWVGQAKKLAAGE